MDTQNLILVFGGIIILFVVIKRVLSEKRKRREKFKKRMRNFSDKISNRD